MEMSHRGKEFIAILAEGRSGAARRCSRFRRTTRVLFMQGGAIGAERDRADEPAARQGGGADYVDTGAVVAEVDRRSAKLRPRQRRRQSSAATPTTRTSRAQSTWQLSTQTPAYVTSARTRRSAASNTIWTPTRRRVPLVADMSSDILSRPIDVAKFGLIYAGRAEEHRPGRAHDRHRPRRPDPAARAPITPERVRLMRAGEADSMFNTPADVRDLPRRADVQMVAGARRAHGDRARQRREGTGAVRGRSIGTGFLSQSRAPGGSRLADERAVLPARSKFDAPAFLEGAKHAGLVQLKGASRRRRHAGIAVQRNAARGCHSR